MHSNTMSAISNKMLFTIGAATAGLAALAAVVANNEFNKKTLNYSLEEYMQQIKKGFITEGFTLEAINRQWEVDRFRLTLMYEKNKKWYSIKHIPLSVPKNLYKILLASCTQVAPALVFEYVVANNPNFTIIHPSAQDYPLRIWLTDNKLKYEMYFRALEPNTLKKGKLIKGLLEINWTDKYIKDIIVSEQRVLNPDN